jgi:ribosomal protein L40E
MENCVKCGAKLPEDAEFCTKCGNLIKTTEKSKKEGKEKKSIEEKIEETAEGIGTKAQKIGKRLEKGAERAGDQFNQWYDRTFKFGGPLIGAFLGLIILRLIIYIVQTSDEEIYIATAFSEGLHEYLLIIFGSLLLTGYNTYIYRKFKQQYQWVYPLFSAIGFSLGAWIAAQILLIISESNETPIFQAIGDFINIYIIAIFILALFIAYIYQFSFGPYLSKEKNK